jgi:hypothetical protein
MHRWRIIIEAWPHSTGAGQEADQKAAGERESYFYVSANDIGEAMRMAQCFAEGIKHNPAVWEAPITGIHIDRSRTT